MESKFVTKPAPPASNSVAPGQIDPAVMAILDQLDEQDERAAQVKRKESRLSYRRAGLRIRVTHPGGGTADRDVIGRDISAHGAAVLYEGFLHPGTKFQLTLNRRLGGQDQVHGKIRYCRHVLGALHIVGLQFDEPISPKFYVDPSVWAEKAKDVVIDATTLKGRLLVLDDQPTDIAIITHYLRGSTVTTKEIACVADALVELKDARIDAILTEMNFDNGERGEQTIVKLREAGYRGPLIVVTAESSTERTASAWAAGATAMLTKPFTRERLLSTLASALTQSHSDSSAELIYSSLFDHPEVDVMEVKPLIEQYLKSIHELAPKFEKAITDDDIEKVRRICQVLKGNGASYGFARVTELARAATMALDSAGSIDEAMSELRALQTTCMRLSDSPPPKN